MHQIEMRDEGMKDLAQFVIKELGVEAIFAQSATEEMIGLYTTNELISPNLEFVLSAISKKYNDHTIDVQLINMKYKENRHQECHFNDMEDVKQLLMLIHEMVKQEEEIKQKIMQLINKNK